MRGGGRESLCFLVFFVSFSLCKLASLGVLRWCLKSLPALASPRPLVLFSWLSLPLANYYFRLPSHILPQLSTNICTISWDWSFDSHSLADSQASTNSLKLDGPNTKWQRGHGEMDLHAAAITSLPLQFRQFSHLLLCLLKGISVKTHIICKKVSLSLRALLFLFITLIAWSSFSVLYVTT